MNNLDKRYQELLRDILDNGVEKKDRTGTGTISVFGRQIRHKMSEGFPLLTTKRMPFKTIMTELLWFLRGDTNIKFLVDNGCHIWDGDAFKNFMNTSEGDPDLIWNQDQFIEMIKTDDEFAKQWGQLGPVYGKQWRSWGNGEEFHNGVVYAWQGPHDQIKSLIEDLKTNPDSRRLMVTAWNPAELQEMVLPPCHYGFQVYTRELTFQERLNHYDPHKLYHNEVDSWFLDELNVPTRAISLMWNQRSVDTFLGLPFNIASYGLLLEIIAKAVNMVPDELIGNLGDVHLYSNHVEQAKEQIGREMTWEEQVQWVMKNTDVEMENLYIVEEIAKDTTPKHTRQPYPLPTLNINTEWWPTESGECGGGPIDAIAVFNAFNDNNFCRCLLEEDLQLSNYQSYPHIKAPLSN
jgi:thymidylate synthase